MILLVGVCKTFSGADPIFPFNAMCHFCKMKEKDDWKFCCLNAKNVGMHQTNNAIKYM